MKKLYFESHKYIDSLTKSDKHLRSNQKHTFINSQILISRQLSSLLRLNESSCYFIEVKGFSYVGFYDHYRKNIESALAKGVL